MVYLDGYLGARRHRLLGKVEPPAVRVLNGARRRHVIDQIVNVLSDWRASEFENEGICRAALRVGLIGQGQTWVSAEAEATSILEACFARLGYRRPSWNEGQREYVVPVEDCNWCGRPIPEDERGHGRQGRFCSAACARAAISNRDFANGYRASIIGSQAYRIISRERRPEKVCAYCGVTYKPFHRNGGKQLFCSNVCRAKASIVVPERECKTCGKMFRPRQRSIKGAYCSQACHYKRELPARICMCCSQTFRPHTPVAIFCSQACGKKAYKIRQRIKKKAASSNLVFLTAAVFDEWFRKAV